jgi:hypothetical protein
MKFDTTYKLLVEEYIFNESRHIIDQEYYYHGTSSKYLKTILSNGLNTPGTYSKFLKCIDPTKNNKNEISDVYLTRLPARAIAYATERAEELYPTAIYDPVVIVCKISPYTGYLDEDEFYSSGYKGIESKNFEEFLKTFNEHQNDNYNIIVDINRDKDILYRIFRTQVDMESYDIKDPRWNIANQEFHKALEELTKRCKKSSKFLNNIRIPQSITFSGRNRIVGIYRLLFVSKKSLMVKPQQLYNTDTNFLKEFEIAISNFNEHVKNATRNF